MRLSLALLTVATLGLLSAATAGGRPDATPALTGGYKIVSATAVSALTWKGYKGSDGTTWSGFEKGTVTLTKQRIERAVGGTLFLTVPLKGTVTTSYTYVNPTSTRTCPQSYNAAQLGINVGLTVSAVGATKVRVAGGPDIGTSKVGEYGRLKRVCPSQFVALLWHFSDYSTNGYGWGEKTFPAALFKQQRFTITLQGQRTIRDSLASLDPGTANRTWKLVLTLERTR